MRRWLLTTGDGDRSTTVHDRGLYVYIDELSFSTQAESEMHRR
jgi:hypothetical protein